MRFFLTLPAMMLVAFSVARVAAAADPYVGFIYPAGGEAGQTVRVLVGGQNLGNIQRGVIGGSGVTVKQVIPVPGFPSPDGKQRQFMLKWLKNIRDGKKEIPEKPDNESEWRRNAWWDTLDKLDAMQISLVEEDLHVRKNALQATPSIRQLLIVEIRIDKDAELGEREMRLWSPARGASNPKIFYVDHAPHFAESNFTPPGVPPPPPVRITTFPAVIDGQIKPGETDSFELQLKKDDTLVFTAVARKLLPFIGDAVPGHFQPVLRIVDAAGREVAYADDHYFDPDPVLYFKVPASGIYTLEVRDNLYRGRADFVYRIAVAGFRLRLPGAPPPFPVPARMPEDQACTEVLDTATATVIAGTLERPGERDRYKFRGKAGEKVALEVAARSIGSPLDGVLRVFDRRGNLLAEADDHLWEWNVGMIVQQFDPYLLFTCPGDGEYTVELADLIGQGGKAYHYLLRFSAPEESFTVYSGQSTLNIPAGGAAALKLFILRRDGYAGAINISSADERVQILSGGQIPPGAKTATIRLRNKNPAGTPPIALKLFAEGIGNAGLISREILPADELTQAFAYNHLLPARFLCLGTIGNARPRNRRDAPKTVPKTAPKAAPKATATPAAKVAAPPPPPANPPQK